MVDSTKPVINSFSTLAPLIIQQYENYLPTAFDGSLTMLEKVNKVIEYLNQTGVLVNGVVEQWNEVMTWVMNDGLTQAVSDKLDAMVADGTFDTLINQTIFGELNDKINHSFSGSMINLKLLFNAKGDGIADDTTALQNAYNGLSEGVLYIPEGVYNYTLLTINPKKNVTIKGDGSNISVLNYKGTGTALTLDAFSSGSANAPFIDNFNLEGLSIKGDTMQKGIFAQGISRSHWKDVRINGSNGLSGTVALILSGCMLNQFEDVLSSSNDGVVPYAGLQLQAGSRGGSSVGGCSNNLFPHCYFEGNTIGFQFIANGGDQNIFIGGSAENCKNYGGIIGTGCRYNTFINMGYENLGVLSADISDAGIYTKFINCYSNEKILLQGKGGSIDGGYFERVEITSGAETSDVKNITVNHWNTGNGGFINSGKGTRYKNVFDEDTQSYVTYNKPRYSVSATASPFTWTNDTFVPVKVLVFGGSVTQVLMGRGTDSWIEPLPTGTTLNAIYVLMPGDKITLSYSAAPTINIIPLNNI